MFGHSSSLNGAERSMLEIVSDAAAYLSEVHVVLPTDGPLLRHLESHKNVRVHFARQSAWTGKWHWVPIVAGLRWLSRRSEQGEVLRLLRTISPDVVVINTSVIPGPASIAKNLGIPVVWIVREDLFKNGQLRSIVPARFLVKRILARADAICFVSAHLMPRFERKASSASRFFVISPRPLAVPSETRPTSPTGGRLRVITMAGTFSFEKGQHLLLMATLFARIRGCGVQARLIGSGGKAYSILVRVLARLSGAEVLGRTYDMRSEYERTDWTANLSKAEAFGRTMVESVQAFRPVLSVDRGAARRVLGDDGGSLFIDRRSVPALTSALCCIAAESDSDYENRVSLVAARADELAGWPSQFEGLMAAIDTVL